MKASIEQRLEAARNIYDLVWAIGSYKRSVEGSEATINRGMISPYHKSKLKHKIEIYKAVIDRLEQRIERNILTINNK